SEVEDGQMLIGSIDEPLVHFGEDQNDLSLLLVGYGIIENEFLIHLTKDQSPYKP
ncbi:MAG: hypothetical protein Q9191_001874, partial [Dirinaria sp. TL-2023a]